MKDAIIDIASDPMIVRPHGKDPRTALVSGSFDPVTVGHEALVAEASRLFSKVYLTVFVNAEKETLFTLEERKRFLQALAARFSNVEADSCTGYLADYCAEKGIEVVVKCYRDAADYRYECLQAFVNHGRNPRVRTLLLPSDGIVTPNAGISSTAVRGALAEGAPVDSFLPAACRIPVLQAYAAKKRARTAKK